MPLSKSNIDQLKRKLLSNDIEGYLALLCSFEDVVSYTKVKEQKLLVLNSDDRVLTSFKKWAETLFRGRELRLEYNFIDFIKTYLTARESLLSRLHLKSYSFHNSKMSEIVSEYYLIIDEYLEGLFKELNSNVSPEYFEMLNIQEKANFSEILHNNLRGRSNDVFFAFARLLNVISEKKITSKGDNTIFEKDSINDDYIEVFNIAGFLNTYDYVLDNLCYGLWQISKVNKGNIVEYNFEIKDVGFIKAREIGLRRVLASKIIGAQRKSWITNSLEGIGIKALEEAWNYYYGNRNFRTKKYKESQIEFKTNLMELNLEDEILLAYSEGNLVLSAYIKAIVVLAYITVKNSSNFSKIPIKHIQSNISSIYIKGEQIDDNLDFLIEQIPTKNHLSIISKPFIIDNDLELTQVKYFSTDHWVQWIRNAFMKGGKLADTVGKSWEKYVEFLFKNNNWEVLGTSIPIKKDGKIITDIDLLILKDDILFIIQMKVFYSLDINQFSQWKTREKLIRASVQLKNINELALDRYLKDKKAFNIKKRYSLIITNSHMYNGWRCGDSIVVSVNSINQFFNNADVSFVTNKRKVLGTKNYMNSKNTKAQEFINFIETPLDWRLAANDMKITIHSEELEHSVLKMPVADFL